MQFPQIPSILTQAVMVFRQMFKFHCHFVNNTCAKIQTPLYKRCRTPTKAQVLITHCKCVSRRCPCIITQVETIPEQMFKHIYTSDVGTLTKVKELWHKCKSYFCKRRCRFTQVIKQPGRLPPRFYISDITAKAMV